jgi:hypothetical protein
VLVPSLHLYGFVNIDDILMNNPFPQFSGHSLFWFLLDAKSFCFKSSLHNKNFAVSFFFIVLFCCSVGYLS